MRPGDHVRSDRAESVVRDGGLAASADAGSPLRPVCDASLPDGDGAGSPAEPDGAGSPAEPDGATEAAGEYDGRADGVEAGLGAALADGCTTTDGEGVGRSPTGSGPTNTSAARIPIATRIPVANPARIVTADFIRREGTSTDERERRAEVAARMPVP
jgi:hypothetical protein